MKKLLTFHAALIALILGILTEAAIHAASTTAPSTQPSAEFGENLGGIGDNKGDTGLHPQLLTACKALNLKYVRLWLEGGWKAQQPASYWKISHQWKGAAYCCANFQNSEPRCSAPQDGIWTSYWSGFPPPEVTGIYAIQIGNEVNTSAYFNGTPAQLAHLMQLAYPILHAKGYVVIAGSDLNDLTYYQQLNALGAFAWCDRIDVHAYYSMADNLAAMVDKGIAFGASLNPPKPCDCSELGVRMNASNLPLWAAEEGAALTLLKARSGRFFPFSFYPIESLDQACPLTSGYGQDPNFWGAFSKTIGN